jgi:hypothetical protein
VARAGARGGGDLACGNAYCTALAGCLMHGSGLLRGRAGAARPVDFSGAACLRPPARPTCLGLPRRQIPAAGQRPHHHHCPHRHRKGGRARHLQRAHLSGELIVLDVKGEMHRVTA